MKKLIAVLVLLACVVSANAAKEDWKLGIQCWTFNHQSLLKTVDYCNKIGVEHLEIYPGQKIGEGFEGKTHHSMPAKDRKKLLSILKKKGVSLISYGCVKGKTEKEWNQIFQFAKEMGINYLISEPKQEQMELLDKLAKKYDVGVGIHNHANPTPDEVEQRLKGRSNRIGIAPDNGHWTRHGHDNMKSFKRFEGRIFSIHFKDVEKDGKEDVPFGEGRVPVVELLDYLDKSDYKGQMIIEYEAGNEEEDVKKCIDYLNAYIGGKKVASKSCCSTCSKPKNQEFVSINDLEKVWDNYDKKSSGPGWKGVAIGTEPEKKKGKGKKKKM